MHGLTCFDAILGCLARRGLPGLLVLGLVAVTTPAPAWAAEPQASAPGAAGAEDSALIQALNGLEPFKVSERNRSAQAVMGALVAATPCPVEVGPQFDASGVWPGASDWAKISEWSKANAPIGDALLKSQDALVFAMPYGTASVPEAWRSAGVVTRVGGGDALGQIGFGYFGAIRTLGVYSTAEMYRLCAAGQHQKAFDIGVAWLRILRQLVEQPLLEEKLFAMQSLSQALSIHRDVLWTNLDGLNVTLLKKLSLDEYPFLKPTDNQKLRRLAMPEGDRLVAEAVLKGVFSERGKPDLERFAAVLSAQHGGDRTLERFGTSRLWRQVAELHSDLDPSVNKLQDIYDDWWRRWNVRPYTPFQSAPTEFSRANPVRYAAVTSLIRDIERAFAWRWVLAVQINGTATSAGLCGYYLEFRKSWPRDIERAYAVFANKRFDFDPFDKKGGRFGFRDLGASTETIDTPVGRVKVKGCMLWSRGADHEDGGGTNHTEDGSSGDILVWPPLRALAREQGVIQ
jgi:hypothetical protein